MGSPRNFDNSDNTGLSMAYRYSGRGTAVPVKAVVQSRAGVPLGGVRARRDLFGGGPNNVRTRLTIFFGFGVLADVMRIGFCFGTQPAHGTLLLSCSQAKEGRDLEGGVLLPLFVATSTVRTGEQAGCNALPPLRPFT